MAAGDLDWWSGILVFLPLSICVRGVPLCVGLVCVGVHGWSVRVSAYVYAFACVDLMLKAAIYSVACTLLTEAGTLNSAGRKLLKSPLSVFSVLKLQVGHHILPTSMGVWGIWTLILVFAWQVIKNYWTTFLAFEGFFFISSRNGSFKK